jgi:hypothetical protein
MWGCEAYPRGILQARFAIVCYALIAAISGACAAGADPVVEPPLKCLAA